MSEQRDGAGGSFEERLAVARRKQGMDSPPADADAGGKPPMSAMGMGLRVGVELVSALAVAVAIGWWLDGFFNTRPFLLMLFVLLGGAAGVLNVWRLLMPRDQLPRKRPGK